MHAPTQQVTQNKVAALEDILALIPALSRWDRRLSKMSFSRLDEVATAAALSGKAAA